MAVVILHLSDIHIKTPKDLILSKGDLIASATFASLPSASHVFIVASGDIAFSGSNEQYDAASKLFSTIKSTIEKEAECPVSFIFAPGNHDCDFTKNNAARKAIIDSIERQETPEVDDSVISICTEIQKSYFKFRDALESDAVASDDLLWRKSRFEAEGKIIEFDSLNVSWISKLKEEPGRLYFPVARYQDQPDKPADVRLVVLHHPLNWFSQAVYRPFRTFIRKRANVVISGHEHQGNIGLIQEAESDSSAYVEGCVLQENSNNLNGSSFNLITLDLAPSQFSSTRYVWQGKRYSASEEGSWSDYHDLPAKRANSFAITDEFQEILDDPGAFFKHPSGTNITITDIYVFPDLLKIGNGDEKRRVFINSSKLLSPAVTADGVLIEGDEKSGCTSLLFQLYRQYHERGFVPIYIKGKDLKKSTEKDIEKLIERLVEQQYSASQAEAFTQLSRTQKILLLDDFDDSPLRAGDARADLLGALRKRFTHFVVTVGDMFEMHEMLDGDASRALITLTHYKLQPFGHARRGLLISRWVSLGADGTISDAEIIARIDQAERQINAIMQKTVIPSLPLYLITLLQSIDAGRSGEFKDSALGHYYHYLLTEALHDAGVKPEKLTEIFQYCANLAWEFHQKDKRELSELELRAFNDRFTKEWHTVDFNSRIDQLISSRVLCKAGEDYGFRYPYIYYYLKGIYLSENLSDINIRECIKHWCQHLYVRDYANTVLFLAHHTNDDFILRTISDALQNLFSARSPVRFDGDTKSINKLIEDAPKLTYSGEAPVEHRARRNTLRDQFDDGHDGLLDREEESSELSRIAQMTMLFKTTEILGQILKNQYSKIQRNRKGELLENLFNGPLRAIRDFYEYFDENPDALVAEIEAALNRKGVSDKEDERRAMARKVAASLIQFITFVFLLRASQSANSESLLEDVRNIIQKNDSPAFRIIEIGILLDSPKAVPRSYLKQLFGDVKRDLVASRVIQIMVLNRLYMFKTSEQDMQWLSQELGIDLGLQHAITYQEKQKRIA